MARPPVSAMDAVDDLYDNNAFGDEDEAGEVSATSVKTPKQPSSSPQDARTPKSRGSGTVSGVEFDVWVARKDKYERMAQALDKLNVERAANDEQWLEVAVSLAATDCALKTGRSALCDCPGVCRNTAHAVTRQRSRCQCPAKKCSLCGRCINTAPGQITSKMVETLAPFRPDSDAASDAATLPSTVLSLADKIFTAGEGKCLAPGAPRISSAAARMARTVLAQCSVLECGDDGASRAQRPCSCPLRSLGELWVKWTTRHHTFSRVPLTEKEASQFAAGTRQMMEHSEEEPDKFYMTLKWHQAAKPQKGDTAKIAARRALTADQKKQNAFFLTLCKRYWKQAQHRVVEHLQIKLGEFGDLPRDKKAQVSAVLASSVSASAATAAMSVEALATAALELQALHKLGVRRMLQWVEEDAEAVEEQKREELKEKTEGGVAAHSAWVRRKDRLRIRMPTRSPTGARAAGGARFDFSSRGAVRRKDFKAPSSTVELMRHSGLKYVHAMNDGFQGRGGDLDKCRRLLVQEGHVLRANFPDAGGGGYDDGEDGESAGFTGDRFEFERANNPARRRRHEGGQARRQQSQASFEAWVAHKALRDKAEALLALLPRPREVADGPEAAARWEQVGRALKAVDRALVEAWCTWSGGFRSGTACRALWDGFPPVACDVHGQSSALRDALLRLLHRRSVDFRAAFAALCERKHRRELARRDSGVGGHDDVPDELTERQRMERYAALPRREFARFLADQGVVVPLAEAQQLAACFCADGDEDGGAPEDEPRVSMTRFLAVAGAERRAQCRGDADLLLRGVCVWQAACHECGMARAFEPAASGSPLRTELPGHARRRERAGGRLACAVEGDERTRGPVPCAASQWSDAQALPFLRKLELWAAAPREQRALQRLVASGQPPAAPPLVHVVASDGGEGEGGTVDGAADATTSLLLRWSPPSRDAAVDGGAAFFQLETAGAEGSASFRRGEFREICRDPRDLRDNEGRPRGQFLVAGLAPSTRYAFRVRALNGFGAGPYTVAHFVTAPATPPAPVALRVSASSVALAWDESRTLSRRLRDLRRAFDAADADGNGAVSRDEFMDALERRQPLLLDFLRRAEVAADQRAADQRAGPPLSVWDAMDADDSESLSWSEVLSFFRGTWDAANSADEGESDGSDSLPVRSRSAPIAGATRFVLKQCTNEAKGEYVEIYRGAAPTFVVHGLASGSTFQFRVQAENVEGQRSGHSSPVVVNTLLPTPLPPTASGATSAAVRLRWVAADARPSAAYEAQRQSDEISRLLKEWARETSVDDGAVDFRARFDRLDADHSGFLELPELRALLSELGVPPSDERLAALLAGLDADADGRVSFDEFAQWWARDDDVQYVLKRDRGEQSDADAGKEAGRGASRGADMSVVSYRGKETSALVAGLEPNTLYRFRLRIVAPHASSQLSDALEMWTAPAAPSRAGRVSVSRSSALLRWHAGARGAHRFALECKLVETLPTPGGDAPGPGRAAAVNRGEWTRVYEGGEPLAAVGELLPSAVYRVRVVALNRAGGTSERSTVTQLCTPGSREEERAGGGGTLRPSNAAEHFTIECAAEGDLVPGDAVLFCERLHRRNGISYGGGGSLDGANLATVSECSASGGGAVAIGERTVAARVVGARTDPRLGRILSLVVLWSTAQMYEDYTQTNTATATTSRRAQARQSTSAAMGLTLAADLKISRREQSLYRFDAFRKEWLDERSRRAETWDL